MTHTRLGSAEQLRVFKDAAVKERSSFRTRVLICMTGCRALGAQEVAAAMRAKLAEAGLDRENAVVNVGCHGQCSRAPLVLVEPFEYLYGGVRPEDAEEIVETTILRGKPVERLCEEQNGGRAATLQEVDFYRHQRREVLRHCGRIDPERIEDAIACDGYAAAARVLGSMSPQEAIDEVRKSGLRGRGGAGFMAGLKWDLCRKAPGSEKYVVCNADEGDPGAFMDRALLEGNPHQVLEGMIIAAYAIGAHRGFVYVRAEYPIAVDHVGAAIEQSRACGLLGNNILGSGFDLEIEIRMGAGAFVCGEETALIASLEGKRGMPRPRPPFPASKGFQGAPTSINNVETFANVPLVISKGSDWYRGIGTEGGTGTKIFALAGKVANTGLVEVPIGATLRQIVYDVGKGIPANRSFKAAQMGGPSGGCVPAQFLDLPIDFDSIRKVGAIMGSGGLIVMDDKTCMVDVARFFLDFTQKESCGKCVPCRVGTRHMVDILTRICSGLGRDGDIDQLEKLARVVKTASLCGLGQTAPNPVLTTLQYFRDEYVAHIKDHRCPSGVCRALITYSIDTDACTACGKCKKVCPTNCISGEKKVPHQINQSQCIKCGMCLDVCPSDAVDVN